MLTALVLMWVPEAIDVTGRQVDGPICYDCNQHGYPRYYQWGGYHRGSQSYSRPDVGKSLPSSQPCRHLCGQSSRGAVRRSPQPDHQFDSDSHGPAASNCRGPKSRTGGLQRDGEYHTINQCAVVIN